MSKSNIFLFICINFILGIALASFLPIKYLNFSYFWVAIILILSILSILVKSKKNISIALLIFCFLFLGVLIFSFNLPIDTNDKVLHYNSNRMNIIGFVDDYVENGKDKQKIVFKSLFNAKDNTKLEGKILVIANQFPQYRYGDKLNIECELEYPENFDGFSYDMYLAMSNIYSLCYRPKIKKIEDKRIKPNFFLINIFKLKRKVLSILDKSMNMPQSGIAKAMLFGDKTSITNDTRNLFAKVGLSHIIAISGMHIGILIAILFLFLEKIGVGRYLSFYISTFFLIFYIVLIGMPSSAVRAGIMGFLVLFAFNIGRLSNVKNSLVFAATILLLFNPLLFRYSISFQLSFLAVLGIVFFYPLLDKVFKKIYKDRKWLKIILDILNVSIVAQIFTLPIIAMNFSTISIISPISNLLVLWTVPFLLIFGFIGLFLSLIFVNLSFIFFIPFSILVSYIFIVMELLAKIPFAYITF